jgi:hypothetical protein
MYIMKERKKMDKNKMVAGGLLIGAGALIANELDMFGDKDDIPLPEKIKQKAGGILGSGAGVTPGTIYNIPASAGVTFPKAPDYRNVFSSLLAPTGVVENQAKPSARRGGGRDFAYAESIPYGADVPKKEVVSRTFLPIAPAGVAAKGAIQTAAGVEAQRISRAGVSGGGAITSFLKDVGGYAVSTPGRRGSAGVVSSRAISSAVRGVTGISKKSTSTPKKKSTYVRRSQKGYTYSKTGSLTKKSSKKEK